LRHEQRVNEVGDGEQIMRRDKAVIFLGIAMVFATASEAPADRKTYSVVKDEHGQVLKTPDGRTVLRYMTKKPAKTNLTANSVCCLYPVYTPKGVRVVDFAPGDHRHHRGVFLAWHALTCGDARADFWGWGEWAPTDGRVIVNRGVSLAKAGAEQAVLAVENDWMIGQRNAMNEKTTITVQERGNTFVIDEHFLMTPSVNVTLDQTAFGGFCVKGRKDGSAYYTDPKGKTTLRDPHHLKPKTDWPAADWYDYSVELEDGPTVGIAVIDHAENPPSTWHNLKPIAMLNPCIVAPGKVTIPKGRTLRLRYRLVVHDGPPPASLLQELAREWRAE
jgi:hypothetical protein